MEPSSPKDGKKGIGLSADDPSFPYTPVGKSWFFGIAINEYRHFPNLHNAVKDVQDLILILRDSYGQDPEHTITLFDESATRDNIIDQLHALVKKVGPRDKLLLYYSGHGHLDRDANLTYWIPHDASRDRTSSYIPNSTVRDYIKTIPAFHTFLISDSCFSGALFLRGTNRSDTAADELEHRRSRWGMVSGRHDEEVYDGEPGTNSPFAAGILKVLTRNRQAKLNVARLADQVIELTRANYQQLPEGNPLFGVGHEGGQYIFRLLGSETNLWERCRLENSLSAYNAYLDQFPNGPHADEALQSIRDLEEEREWQSVRRIDRVYAYRAFLRSFPEGKYSGNAQERIREIQDAEQSEAENQLWQLVKERDTQLDYENYLRKYPSGKYADQATSRLQALESERLQKERIASISLKQEPDPVTISSPTKEANFPGWLSKKTALYLSGALLLICLALWGISQMIGKPVYSAELTPFEDPNNNQYGYRTRAGEVTILPQFDYAYPFSEDRAVVEKDSLHGVIDPTGRLVLGFKYSSIESFSHGLAMVIRDNKYGFIDTSGREVIPVQFDNAGSFDETGEAYAELDGKEFSINKTGKCVRNCPAGQASILSPSTNQSGPADWDDNTWEEAIHFDKIESYQAYLSSFPNGKHGDEARQRIGAIYEEAEWAEIQKENTVAAYTRFLIKYANGKYADEAEKRKQELEKTTTLKTPAKPYPKKSSAVLGRKTYRTIQFEAGGLIWMAQNLNYEIDSSWCQDNDPDKCTRYGRLYNWEAAKKACQAFGWRLPTDREWQEMTKKFGGTSDHSRADDPDVDRKGMPAYNALFDGGESGFNALRGGVYDPEKKFFSIFTGSYWSDTKKEAEMIWVYKFYPLHVLYRSWHPQHDGLSCRCVRE